MRLKSYAKINLILNVLGKRNDGYHDILTVFQHIDLADNIALENHSQKKITISCNIKELENEKNLCYKTARLLLDNFGIEKGVAIRIDKKIPLGSGLSGGSSNAAVVLKGLNSLWNLNIPLPDLMKIGQEIGMDVGFHLVGGTCLGSGRGEIIKKLKNLDRHYLVLIYPGFEISSKNMYANLRYDLIAGSQNHQRLPEFLKTYDLCFLNNDFEYTIKELYPEIYAVKEKLGPNALLSGSGSCVFGLYKIQDEAQKIYLALKNDYKHVFLCQTLSDL